MAPVILTLKELDLVSSAESQYFFLATCNTSITALLTQTYDYRRLFSAFIIQIAISVALEISPNYLSELLEFRGLRESLENNQEGGVMQPKALLLPL